MRLRKINAYSRFVAWAKIILPLIGLGILSALFLFSDTGEPNLPIGMTKAELKDFASKQRITNPRFAGMTTAGVAIQLSAAEASPDNRDATAYTANDLHAKIETSDGATVVIVAQRGTIDSISQIAQLTDNISLTTSDGYVAKTPGLSFSLDRLDVESQGKITAKGPLGLIEAGRLHITADSVNEQGNSTGYVLLFKDGVKLIYTP
jgi:lipopolysaccharide export system protein LptC